jgi:putative heme iron utilization protein
MKLLVEGPYATIHTPFVLHEGKVYFLGSNRAEFDKNLQKMPTFSLKLVGI